MITQGTRKQKRVLSRWEKDGSKNSLLVFLCPVFCWSTCCCSYVCVSLSLSAFFGHIMNAFCAKDTPVIQFSWKRIHKHTHVSHAATCLMEDRQTLLPSTTRRGHFLFRILMMIGKEACISCVAWPACVCLMGFLSGERESGVHVRRDASNTQPVVSVPVCVWG